MKEIKQCVSDETWENLSVDFKMNLYELIHGDVYYRFLSHQDFTIGKMIEILSEKYNVSLHNNMDDTLWYIHLRDLDFNHLNCFEGEELVDALFEALCYVLEQPND